MREKAERAGAILPAEEKAQWHLISVLKYLTGGNEEEEDFSVVPIIDKTVTH